MMQPCKSEVINIISGADDAGSISLSLARVFSELLTLLIDFQKL